MVEAPADFGRRAIYLQGAGEHWLLLLFSGI